MYKLCAGNDPTGITWEHDQLHSHLFQSIHFQGKVGDLVALLGLQFKPLFFASAVFQKDSQQTWLGASNMVNGTTKPAPTSLKVFQGKESHGPVKL